jgi:hypothetical protein
MPMPIYIRNTGNKRSLRKTHEVYCVGRRTVRACM